MKPVCSKCIYMTTEAERFRKCAKIPIFHRDMSCSNKNNVIKDHVSGDSYRPYCEEVNRHGECLEYYPEGLETPEISRDFDFEEITIKGSSPLIVTTDGENPDKKMPQEGTLDSEGNVYHYELKPEHTCTIKAACVLDDVLSPITECFVEIADIPSIQFDRETNTVTINSYNKVYYSTDGSKITEESKIYDGPFVIDHNVIIKCRSFANNEFSEEVSLSCISIEPPVINYDIDTREVSIEADDTILFSVDGSDIFDDSEEYKKPFVIDKNTTVKAACLTGDTLSEQVELECKVPNAPEITFDQKSRTVTISSENTVLYTTDGSDVKKKDLEYTSPFKVYENCVIKAVSIVEGRLSDQAELGVEIS